MRMSAVEQVLGILIWTSDASFGEWFTLTFSLRNAIGVYFVSALSIDTVDCGYLYLTLNLHAIGSFKIGLFISETEEVKGAVHT